MPPDHASALTAAAQRKHHTTLTRARAALADLDQQAQPITFQGVARRAGVSRQWLYQQPELRAEIERLRDRHPGPHAARLPAADRAGEGSLRQRNSLLLADNRRLREENAALRDELAILYGESRQARRR